MAASQAQARANSHYWEYLKQAYGLSVEGSDAIIAYVKQSLDEVNTATGYCQSSEYMIQSIFRENLQNTVTSN